VVPASVASTTAMESATASVKPAASMKFATAAMEASVTTEAATAVEATVTSEAFVYKSAAAKAVTTTVKAPTVVTTAIEAAAVIAPAIETRTVEPVEPRASPDEHAVYEPIRAVVTVRRASVWGIIIVAIGANRSRANISVPWANSNAHDHSLCVCERCRA
jgi:hypothetical protein